TVVVERRPPKHGTVGHHASADVSNLLDVAAGATAGSGHNAQVAGIYELDKFPALFEPFRISADGIGGAALILFVAWLDVGFLLGGVILAGAHLCRSKHGGVAQVTVSAADADRVGFVHGQTVGLRMTGEAASGLAVSLFRRLSKQKGLAFFAGLLHVG